MKPYDMRLNENDYIDLQCGSCGADLGTVFVKVGYVATLDGPRLPADIRTSLTAHRKTGCEGRHVRSIRKGSYEAQPAPASRKAPKRPSAQRIASLAKELDIDQERLTRIIGSASRATQRERLYDASGGLSYTMAHLLCGLEALRHKRKLRPTVHEAETAMRTNGYTPRNGGSGSIMGLSYNLYGAIRGKPDMDLVEFHKGERPVRVSLTRRGKEWTRRHGEAFLAWNAQQETN